MGREVHNEFRRSELPNIWDLTAKPDDQKIDPIEIGYDSPGNTFVALAEKSARDAFKSLGDGRRMIGSVSKADLPPMVRAHIDRLSR
ncbi:MAG: hypothetical protein HRT94_00570 [Alphaproteobacteria bacterium]|nr:hypothetical protein [Alphaproteobacteria bacterium]